MKPARILLTALVAWAVVPAIGTAQNLILNDLHGQTLAYEMPESEGRAAAVHYIEQMRDRFYPGAKIVDAASLDDTALRESLKGTLVLYTILSQDSRLLRLAAQPLPLRIENGMLHYGDLAAPVKDLRMVFAGKNPYGDGYSIVYTAGSTALLAQANNVLHGPCSYHIYQGPGRGQLLREGFYDRNFVERSDRLAWADTIADIDEFFSTLEHTHPKLLTRVSKQSYEQLKKQTRIDVKARVGEDGKVRIEDLAWTLYYAAAFIQDGHTSLQWFGPRLSDTNTRDKRFPPFWLDSENGRLFIVSSVNAALTGMEILEVNGTPVDDFLKPILDRCSAETRTYRAARFVGLQLFWYAYSNVFGAESYAVKVRDLSGATRQETVRTLAFGDFISLAPKRERPRSSHVEFLDDDKIARLVIPSLVYGADHKKADEVFDLAFAEIRQRGSKDLVIDIRGNGGGNSQMGDYVLRLVHKQFTGKTYMLIDHYVFSSALMFADAFRDDEVGTIIGYETGGLPNHYGFPQMFKLKNSGIDFSVSRRHFQAHKPRPGDDEHGVLPDVPVNRSLLAPYKDDADPMLGFALAYIRKGRQE